MKDIYRKDLIFKIAAAASVTDCKVYEDGEKKYVKVPELNHEYKYAQTIEWDPRDKERAVICSKDLKVWEVCIGVRMLTDEYLSKDEFVKLDAEVRMAHYGKDTPEDIREKEKKEQPIIFLFDIDGLSEEDPK